MIRLLLALVLVLLAAWPASAARSFNGSSDHLTSASAITLSGSSKLTVAFWGLIDAYTGVEKEMLDYGDGASFNGTFILIPDAAGPSVFYVYLQDISPAKLAGVSFPRPSAGFWHHYVMTFDRSLTAADQIVGIWVDAVAQTLTPQATDDVQSAWGDLALNVMARNNGASGWTNGRIAELALYSGYDFLQADVNALYASGLGVAATSVQNAHLSYYWPICGSASPETATTGGINLTVSGTTSAMHPSNGPCGTVPTVAGTCGQADIVVAITHAVDGNTVTVPAGSCTWTGQITLTKAITIQGAGIGQTIITDAKVRASNDGVLLLASIPQGSGVFRLTGFTFQTDGVQTTSDSTIQLTGCSTTTANYRIDNNQFALLTTGQVIRTFGNLYGVVDHNFGTGFSAGHLIASNNTTWPRDGVNCTGQWADGSWAFPLAPGTIKAHYVENNEWAPQNFSGSIIDSAFGGRAVVRHNVLYNTFVGSHGTDTTDRFRGNRWLEAYNNQINTNPGVGLAFGVWVRGGSGVVFNNNITMANLADGIQWYVFHLNLRSNDPGGSHGNFSPWNSTTMVFPACDGTAEWDGNTGGPPCSAGDDTCTAGYRCLDQPGAGTSVDYNDVTSTTGLGPAGNALEPIYVWDNTINGSANNCGTSGFGCGSDGVVVVNRDIYFGTARPGYTSFTYPHPLTQTTSPFVPKHFIIRHRP